MEQLILETISRHMKGKKVMRSSWHALMKMKTCLINLMNFSDWIISLVDEEKAVDIFYLDFRKAFNTVSWASEINITEWRFIVKVIYLSFQIFRTFFWYYFYYVWYFWTFWHLWQWLILDINCNKDLMRVYLDIVLFICFLI